MNNMSGSVSGWMGGGMGYWTPIGVLVVVLVLFLIIRRSKKQ